MVPQWNGVFMRAFLAILAVVAFFLIVSCSDTRHNPNTTAPSETFKSSGEISVTTVSNSKSDVTGLVFNTCTSELVSFSGTVHSKFKTKSKNNGYYEVSSEFNTKASGTGFTSGDKYEVLTGSSASTTFEAGPPFPVVRDIILERTMISQGNADNATFLISIHIEVDADGNTVADEFSFETECK